jgi:hypothetical protein
MTAEAADQKAQAALQRRKDDLLTMVRSTQRQLDNIRAALADLDGHVGSEMNGARESLRSADDGVATIGQIATRWGATS